jgi:hypothetical protein
MGVRRNILEVGFEVMDTKLWLYPSLVLGTRHYAQACWEVLLLESFQIEIKYCIAKWNFLSSFQKII